MEQETEQTSEERLAAAQQRLAAELLSPNASVPIAPPSLDLSEMETLKRLLETVVVRVDQVAKTSAEQFSRQERTNSETEKTMLLAREMIVQMDQQYTEMTELIVRLETGLEALVRVQANLTEIVAALLAPPQKG